MSGQQVACSSSASSAGATSASLWTRVARSWTGCQTPARLIGMTAIDERVAQLLAVAPPLTDEQAEPAARILYSVMVENRQP